MSNMKQPYPASAILLGEYHTRTKRNIVEGMLGAWEEICMTKDVCLDLEIKVNCGVVSCRVMGRPGTSPSSTPRYVHPQEFWGDDAYPAGWRAAKQCCLTLLDQSTRKEPKE